MFDSIVVSFLPVGHTHNECDQCASSFSSVCRRHTIECRTDLVKLLRHCRSDILGFEHVDHVADMRKLLNPSGAVSFANGPCHRLKGVSKPLHFRITKDAKQRVCLKTKMSIRQVRPHTLSYAVSVGVCVYVGALYNCPCCVVHSDYLVAAFLPIQIAPFWYQLGGRRFECSQETEYVGD